MPLCRCRKGACVSCVCAKLGGKCTSMCHSGKSNPSCSRKSGGQRVSSSRLRRKASVLASPDPRLPGKKSKLQHHSGRKKRSETERKKQEEAATTLQRMFRGSLGRERANHEHLWQAWNLLDWKEESELGKTYRRYKQIKREYQTRHVGAASVSREREQQLAQHTATKPPALVRGSSLLHRDPEDQENQRFALSVSAALEMRRTRSLTRRLARGKNGKQLTHVDLPELGRRQPLSLVYVTKMIDEFKDGKVLQRASVMEMLSRLETQLRGLPNVTKISLGSHSKITVVGDIHGQLDDLLCIFQLNGLPSPSNQYLFNGDIVDRGQNSAECVLTVFAFKLLYPNAVHINRGNHEAADINSRDGFEREAVNKFDAATYDAFEEVFSCLPLAAVIGGKVFVVHGGLSWDDFTLSDIEEIDRFETVVPEECLFEDMLWSDPNNKVGRRENARGAGCEFGPDVCAAFLRRNKFSLVVRSHECVENGFRWHFDKTLVTVFSASNYCGCVGNQGAVISFDKTLKPQPVQYYAGSTALSRVSLRAATLQSNVIDKLLLRIAANRLSLTDYYTKLSRKRARRGKLGRRGMRGGGIWDAPVVSRAEWARGLTDVLGLAIPWLKFARYLGVPDLGVDGKPKGPINFMTFLARFRPVLEPVETETVGTRKKLTKELASLRSSRRSKNSNGRGGGRRGQQLVRAQLKRSDSSGQRVLRARQGLKALSDVLFAHRLELESLWRFFDLDGSGSVDRREFRDGIEALSASTGMEFSEEDIRSMFNLCDVDGDGTLRYEELFAKFRLQDAALFRDHLAQPSK